MQTLIAYLAATWVALLSIFGFPPPAALDNQTSFIIFGDSGTGSLEQKMLAGVMQKYPIDMLLHSGDIAYDNGTEEELQKNFFDVYGIILKKTPFYPTPGNHDYITNGLAPYLARFAKDKYYSFDSAYVHFISVDSVGVIDKKMTEWLEEDLRNAQGKKWTVVYFHYPPFSSGSNHGGSKEVREQLVPLFSKYGVDVVFSGHEHNYERMKPIDEVTYIVTGGGGASLYDFGEPTDITAFRAKEYHFVYARATSCEFTGEAINMENRVIDTFRLSRCAK